VLRKVAAVPIRSGGSNPGGLGYPGGSYDPGYGTFPNGNRRSESEEAYEQDAYDGPANPVPGPNGPDSTYPSTRGNYPPVPNNAPYSESGSYRVMSGDDVAGLVQFLKEKSFDDNKLPIIKDALSESGVQAADLARLIRTLSFESNRLELAKFAYARVVDRQNLYRVYDAFEYASTAKEMQEFVSQQRGR
jgi:hypothetical protein